MKPQLSVPADVLADLLVRHPFYEIARIYDCDVRAISALAALYRLTSKFGHRRRRVFGVQIRIEMRQLRQAPVNKHLGALRRQGRGGVKHGGINGLRPGASRDGQKAQLVSRAGHGVFIGRLSPDRSASGNAGGWIRLRRALPRRNSGRWINGHP